MSALCCASRQNGFCSACPRHFQLTPAGFATVFFVVHWEGDAAQVCRLANRLGTEVVDDFVRPGREVAEEDAQPVVAELLVHGGLSREAGDTVIGEFAQAGAALFYEQVFLRALQIEAKANPDDLADGQRAGDRFAVERFKLARKAHARAGRLRIDLTLYTDRADGDEDRLVAVGMQAKFQPFSRGHLICGEPDALEERPLGIGFAQVENGLAIGRDAEAAQRAFGGKVGHHIRERFECPGRIARVMPA